MKYIILFILLLCSCSKEQSTAKPDHALLESDYLSNPSTSYSEEEFTFKALDMIKKHIPLSTKKTEQCWSLEASRENIQKTCMLLWAIGKEESPMLSNILLEKSNKDPFYGMLLAKRPELIIHLDKQKIITLLKQFKEGPFWLKTKLAATWLQIQSQLPVSFKDEFIQELSIGFSDQPKALYEYGLILKKLDSGAWSGLLQKYCNINIDGINRFRCWRFISLFSKEIEENSDWKKQLRFLLPKINDPDWTLFVRNFPLQSRRIQLIP